MGLSARVPSSREEYQRCRLDYPLAHSTERSLSEDFVSALDLQISGLDIPIQDKLADQDVVRLRSPSVLGNENYRGTWM